MAGSGQDDEVTNVRAVIITTAITAVVVVGAHVVLAVNYVQHRDLPWQPVVGIALSTVSLVAFGGFYVAARRARVAIGAAFILTFLTMLPFALTIPALAGNAETELARNLVKQFSAVVGTVVAFYFGTEAVISGLKLWTISKNPEASDQIRTADRDLATRTVKPKTTES